MAEVKVRCSNPQCPASYKVDESILGRRARCKKCQTSFVLTRAEKQTSGSASPPAGIDAGVRQERRPGVDGVPESWEVGDVILDQYEVRRVLGEGGMGKVHLVHHRGWQTDLAVKSVRPDRLKSQKHLEDFQREAEVWINKLGLHPHVVSCYYVRVLGGLPRVFIDYVDGGSLRDWVRNGKLYEGGPEQALDRILDVAIQFAWGLHYAHEQGLIHQDVKPDNVMMTGDGVARVTDFGIARAREAAGEQGDDAQPGQSLVVPGVGLCTREYASPEQLGKQQLTRRTDIWSWAVSVLEMFIPGLIRKGFLGPAAPVALEQYLREGASVEGAPSMPEEVAALLRDCFQKDPDARPRTMLQIADSLREVYQRVTGQPHGRRPPVAAKLLADSLNNRAVSLLDLGKSTEAMRCWQEALRADADHPASSFNAGLLAWRTAEIDDNQLLTGLRELVNSRPNEWQPVHSLASVLLERGDADAALAELDRLSPDGKMQPEVQTLLAAARRLAGGAGKEPRALDGFHRNALNAIRLSPDGKYLVSGGGGSTYGQGGCEVKLWDVASGKCTQTLDGHSSSVYCVCLSPDARHALSGGDDRTLRLWDLQTGQCLHTWGEHGGPVWACALTKNGRYALSAGLDATLRVWDVASGSRLRTLRGSHGQMRSLCLSPDNKTAAVGCWGGAVVLWDLVKGQAVRTFEGHGEAVVTLAFSKDGRHLFSGSFDGNLCQWEVASGQRLRTFAGHTGHVTAVCLSRDGRFAVSGSKDRTLRLWELSTGRCLRLFESEATGYVEINAVAMSPDGKDVFFGGGSYNTTVGQGIKVLAVNCHLDFPRAPFAVCRVTSAETVLKEERAFQDLLGQAIEASAQSQPATAARLLRQARSLPGFERNSRALAAWMDLYTRLPRAGLSTAWEARPFPGRHGEVAALALSRDGSQLLLPYEGQEGGERDASEELWRRTGGRTGKFTHGVELLDLREGGQARAFQGHDNDVSAVGLSDDGRLALSGCKDGLIRCWDVASGDCRWSAEHLVGTATSFALGRDGRWCLVGGAGIEPPREMPKSDEGEILHVSWDEDYFFHNRTSTLGLLDMSEGRLLRILEGHRSPVTAVVLSPDERLAISASHDRTVRVWDLPAGKCLRTLDHPGAVLAISLSEDGHFLLAGCGPEIRSDWFDSEARENNLLLWDMSTGELLATLPGHADGTTAVSLSPDGRHALSGGNDEVVRIWNVAKRECVRVFENLGARVQSVALSPDGRYAFAGLKPDWGADCEALKMWALDWELEEKEMADWDESARPYLEAFLTRQTPCAAPLPVGHAPTEAELELALTRRGKPSWTEVDFQRLLDTLGFGGFGWLRPDGVRRELEKMAATWQGPSSLM